MTLFLFLFLWVASGLLATGILFAVLQRNFPEFAEEEYYLDLLRCYGMSVFGPLAVIAVFFAVITSDVKFKGLKFK